MSPSGPSAEGERAGPKTAAGRTVVSEKLRPSSTKSQAARSAIVFERR